MKAELFEDGALNNISPLPEHFFDVPKTETRPNGSAIFVLIFFLSFFLFWNIYIPALIIQCHTRYWLLLKVIFMFTVGVVMYLEDLKE